MATPVIVTRAAHPGQRLALGLQKPGRDVMWWPAFDIAGPADDGSARKTLQGLAQFDLALFVSPNAVHATAQRLVGEWPATTIIGVVGSGTREAVMSELRGASRATIIGPDNNDEPGSEAFWRVWQAGERHARRMLLLRAESGRDWIMDQFRTAGTEVVALPIYQRLTRRLDIEDTEWLARSMRAEARPVIVFTSTEAVGALFDQVEAVDGAVAWLKSGAAVITHARVAQRLHSEGFRRVELTDIDDDAIVRTLESIAG